MRVLAVESYYGGSHKAFIDGWIKHSKHDFDLISYPAYKWKWRMRHSAVSAGIEAKRLVAEGGEWDLLFVSDMLGLAEFIGLAPPVIAGLPRVAYFHENQLTYPDRNKGYRDMHFPYMNFTTALAADRVWFNTGWHRDEFLSACKVFLKKMPDYRHLGSVDDIAEKSGVYGQGISPVDIDVKNDNNNGKLKITWAARWEHDKNPEDLYKLLVLLKSVDFPFSINVIGESFNQVPEEFARIKNEFSEYIDRFGFQPGRDEYYAALAESDLIISTAVHEFFGVSVIEGCACGALPLAPRRLAYPEVLEENEYFLYDNTAEALFEKILKLDMIRGSEQWQRLRQTASDLAAEHYWHKLAAKMDSAIEEII